MDCKTVGFFLKISKEIGKAWRKSLCARASHTHRACEAREKIPSLPSPASFQTFCLTACAYLNTQKYTDCFAVYMTNYQ